MKYWVILAGALTLLASAQISAALINFEDASSHGLFDNDLVTIEYQSSDGVTFTLAILEKVGVNAPDGFTNNATGLLDDPFPAPSGSLEMGNWFLRSSRGSTGSGVFLSVLYDNPVTAASAQIWDIDGTSSLGSEKWLVKAYFGSTFVTSITSPGIASIGAGSLDGLPWTFNLSAAGGFDRLDFVFDGSKTRFIGLAFDNFNTDSLTSTSAIPVPSSLWNFGIGLAVLGLCFTSRRTRRAVVQLAQLGVTAQPT